MLGVENFNAIPRPRINRMKQDMSKIADRYKHSVLDQPDGAVSEEEKQSHLALLQKELQSVVRHQCGIHTFCTTNTCDWIRLSIAHPDWSDGKLDGKAKPAKPGREKKIDQQCQKCKQLGHTRAECQCDDADDVVVYAGKKRRSPGSNKKSARNNKKAKTNFGVSANDVSSWMPAILRENGSL